tara:strand:- start:664 stop:930 length:267 start_codon:yes stop_codon:yes gene_type:complete
MKMTYRQALEKTANVSLTIHCQIEDYDHGCKELAQVIQDSDSIHADQWWITYAQGEIKRRGWIFRAKKDDDFAAQQYVCPVCLANEKD